MLLSVLLFCFGGTDPDGGFGKVSGIIIGLFTLQSLTSGFNLMNVNLCYSSPVGCLAAPDYPLPQICRRSAHTWLIKKSVNKNKFT